SQPQKQKPLKALIAGLSEMNRVSPAHQGFSGFPLVEVEVEKISSMITSSVLLNQSFTTTALENALNSSSFPIVHLATHSEIHQDSNFNSKDTFILAWDERITPKDFEELLSSRKQEKLNPIELLVLSACKSADGNNQTPFGFPGFALRSRVRSILGSLWFLNGETTTELMVQFYQEFTQRNVTKAEALRRAQLTLLKEPGYQATFFWAPFVLIGDWR
ncbi:MAG: CHAT domain-containing protein, partial [Moorea sp. SIO4G2]|nr:CHAT domain-containing protein [Moorena sp. SIO4G2]